MKRILALTLMFTLLSILSAQAEIWFPDSSGTLLHRDPFCIERTLTLESYFMPSLQFDSKEVIEAAGAYAICPNCDVDTPAEPPAAVKLYYNPDGGERLHYDPECPSVSARYLPMISAELAAEETRPAKLCSYCAPHSMESPADARAWNASIEKKADYLPGVWTLPSEHSLSADEAYTIAREWIQDNLPTRTYSVCPMHYDHGLTVGDQHETYKVIITTALRHPLHVLYLDAVSGEVYCVETAMDSYKY